jgi:putative spermidine/putrescine transport system substrate-binding protein
MTRRVLVAALLILIVAAAALYWVTRPLPILTVTSWAGPYGRAQASAMMRPYGAAKSVDVRLALWDGDLSDLARGDVVDFELPRVVEACRRGLLERIDAKVLPPGTNGVAAKDDFVAGALGPCWVGSVVYAQVIVAGPGTAAKTLADFFDTQKFPGRRALNRASAKFNLEMALLADGVAPRDVYKTLDTPAGLTRAFDKLKALNPIWAHDGGDALNWVKNGQAVMATALNGDVHDAARKGFKPSVIWDCQLYEMDAFAIPKDNPNKARALDFIATATGSVPLAGVAGWVPYGPARRSSLALLHDDPETGEDMRAFLPTAPEHFQTAFAVDDGWWLGHGAAIAPRWQAFVMATQ